MSTAAIINPPAVTREAVRSLAQIEADIDHELSWLKLTKLKLGRLLLEAKEQVSHGEWADWVEARGIKMRSGQNYMALAKNANLAYLPDAEDATYRDAGMDPRPQQSVDDDHTGARAGNDDDQGGIRAQDDHIVDDSNDGEEEPSQLSDVEIKQRGIAVNHAQEAINNLILIPADNCYRDRAFEIVQSYIHGARQQDDQRGRE